MNPTILTFVMALLFPVLCMAQSRGDPSRMQESGPAVVGGTGATLGPNSKNQAIMPMPGSEQELAERPPDAALRPLPYVRPVPGPARALPKAKPEPR